MFYMDDASGPYDHSKHAEAQRSLPGFRVYLCGVDWDRMLTRDGSASQACFTRLGEGLGDELGDCLADPGDPCRELASLVWD